MQSCITCKIHGQHFLIVKMTFKKPPFKLVQPRLFISIELYFDVDDCFRTPGDEADISMIGDCYQCLTCIANRLEGREALIRHRSVAALCTVLARDLYGKRNSTVTCKSDRLIHTRFNWSLPVSSSRSPRHPPLTINVKCLS